MQITSYYGRGNRDSPIGAQATSLTVGGSDDYLRLTFSLISDVAINENMLEDLVMLIGTIAGILVASHLLTKE